MNQGRGHPGASFAGVSLELPDALLRSIRITVSGEAQAGSDVEARIADVVERRRRALPAEWTTISRSASGSQRRGSSLTVGS